MLDYMSFWFAKELVAFFIAIGFIVFLIIMTVSVHAVQSIRDRMGWSRSAKRAEESILRLVPYNDWRERSSISASIFCDNRPAYPYVDITLRRLSKDGVILMRLNKDGMPEYKMP